MVIRGWKLGVPILDRVTKFALFVAAKRGAMWERSPVAALAL